jgi:3-oxoacyl-(acyl-carrier-protein) synthase
MSAALSTCNDAPKSLVSFDKRGWLLMAEALVRWSWSPWSMPGAGAKVLCEFAGYGISDDAPPLNLQRTAPGQPFMRLAPGGLKPADIGYINAHGTSTQLNDKSETAAIKNVFGEQAYNVPISSTKSMTGHLMGASGSVEVVICTQVFQHNTLPATINYEVPDPNCDLDYVPNHPRLAEPDHIMSNSFGFGGHNATLILSRYQE